MILSCSNISKAFGSEVILENISFHIEEHEKAAVVGINGAGKTTLLKIIIGELPADSGNVVIARGKTIGYLAQHQDLESSRTIYEEVLEIKRPLIDGRTHPSARKGDEAHPGRCARIHVFRIQPLKPSV